MADKRKKLMVNNTVSVSSDSSANTEDSPPSVSQEISPLKKFTESTDILLMLYPKDEEGNFQESIQSKDEIVIYDLLKEKEGENKALLILLDTSGGNVYSAVKIMDCLRTKYEHITIAIPQEAKSSGTMMCFGADKLIMSSIAELGPLDKPLRHPDNENAFISALDIVRSIDDTIKTAIDRQQELAGQINDKFGIRAKGSLGLASDYMSKLISPMLSHEDVKIYNQAKRLLAIAEQYGTEFLDKNMFKRISSNTTRARLIELVVRQFVWLYPDHAFAVRRGELRNWFFNVDDAEALSYWPELWKEFKSNLGSSAKQIRFLDIK